MKNQICQLCCCDYDNSVTASTSAVLNDNKNNSHLINLIYKHLHITIQDIHNVCIQCEQIIIHWDQFAQKCWTTQTILQENNVKLEDNSIPVKEENFPEVFIKSEEENEYSDDDNYSIPECSIKIEDQTTQNENDLSDSEEKKIESISKPKSAVKKNNQKIKKRSFDCVEMICHICSVTIEKWAALKSHCLKEHSTKPNVLCVCGKYLTSKSTIANHRILHNDDKGAKCDLCSKKYVNNKDLKEHILSAHTSKEEYTYNCDQCPRKFYSIKSLKEHSRYHTKPKNPCDICGALLTTKCGLKLHKKSLHQNLKPCICDECGKAFSTSSALKAHKVSHKDEKNYKCDKCDKRYKFLFALKQHQETHNEAGYKCPQCPQILTSRSGLRTHLGIHSLNLKYSCTLCNKQYNRKYHLQRHLKTHNPNSL